MVVRKIVGQMVSEFGTWDSDQNGFHATFHLVCSTDSDVPLTLEYPVKVTDKLSLCSLNIYHVVLRRYIVKIYYNPAV